MFKEKITMTPFTTTDADTMFHNISAEGWGGDKSLETTLRALVGGMIPSSEGIHVIFKEMVVGNPDIEMFARSVARDTLYRDGTVGVVNVKVPSGQASEVMRLLETSFNRTEVFDHAKEVENFYRGSFGVLCYLNADRKCAILCVENITLPKLHYIQCAIPALLPWYFKSEDGVFEYQMELLNSLREKTADHYIDCIGRIAEMNGLREQRTRRILRDFENKNTKTMCEQLSADIDRIDDRIKGYSRNIADLLSDRNTKEVMLMGYREKLTANDSSPDENLEGYFLANKNLTIVEIDNTRLTFQCKGYLSYYDEDTVISTLNRPYSYVYASAPDKEGSLQAKDAARLIRAVFLDKTIKLRVCATYSIDLNRYEAVGLANQEFPADFSTYMPNPHIDQYYCQGDHKEIIEGHLRDHDYISAIEQCMASCQSLAFTDSTVMSEFMRQIYKCTIHQKNVRAFELPDGRVVEPIQAVLWLREQEGEDN